MKLNNLNLEYLVLLGNLVKALKFEKIKIKFILEFSPILNFWKPNEFLEF
jgi:hypothetical protein